MLGKGKNMFHYKYDITAVGYFLRGISALNSFNNYKIPNFILYVAFEFRCSVERLLFEYLVMMKLDSQMSKSLEKLYHATKLKKTVLNIEPEFNEKIKFINFFLSTLNSNVFIYELDLDIIETYYGKLGNYLHSQKRPEKTSENPNWWKELITFLIEIRDYLGSILENPIGTFKMNERGLELFGAYKSGDKSDEEIAEMIRAEFNNLTST